MSQERPTLSALLPASRSYPEVVVPLIPLRPLRPADLPHWAYRTSEATPLTPKLHCVSLTHPRTSVEIHSPGRSNLSPLASFPYLLGWAIEHFKNLPWPL